MRGISDIKAQEGYRTLRHPVFMFAEFILAELSKELHYLQTLRNQEKELACIRLSHNMRSNTAKEKLFS